MGATFFNLVKDGFILLLIDFKINNNSTVFINKQFPGHNLWLIMIIISVNYFMFGIITQFQILSQTNTNFRCFSNETFSLLYEMRFCKMRCRRIYQVHLNKICIGASNVLPPSLGTNTPQSPDWRDWVWRNCISLLIRSTTAWTTHRYCCNTMCWQ